MKVAERPNSTTIYTYQNGSVHDDKRSQLMLGEDVNNFISQTRLRNE